MIFILAYMFGGMLISHYWLKSADIGFLIGVGLTVSMAITVITMAKK